MRRYSPIQWFYFCVAAAFLVHGLAIPAAVHLSEKFHMKFCQNLTSESITEDSVKTFIDDLLAHGPAGYANRTQELHVGEEALHVATTESCTVTRILLKIGTRPLKGIFFVVALITLYGAAPRRVGLMHVFGACFLGFTLLGCHAVISRIILKVATWLAFIVA